MGTFLGTVEMTGDGGPVDVHVFFDGLVLLGPRSTHRAGSLLATKDALIAGGKIKKLRAQAAQAEAATAHELASRLDDARLLPVPDIATVRLERLWSKVRRMTVAMEDGSEHSLRFLSTSEKPDREVGAMLRAVLGSRLVDDMPSEPRPTT